MLKLFVIKKKKAKSKKERKKVFKHFWKHSLGNLGEFP